MVNPSLTPERIQRLCADILRMRIAVRAQHGTEFSPLARMASLLRTQQLLAGLVADLAGRDAANALHEAFEAQFGAPTAPALEPTPEPLPVPDVQDSDFGAFEAAGGQQS
jgi:hypothetical protein